MLKKQLHQLTTKFEELRAAVNITSAGEESGSSSVGKGPAQEYVVSDLKVQMVVTNQQLSAAKDEIKLLKDKLKECSIQLKEYENDQKGIVSVLEKYDVDTRGLLPLIDCNNASASEVSVQHVDIVDAVAQLGEMIDVARAAATRKETAKSDKLLQLEARVSEQTAAAEDAKAQKFALEKRIEALKASSKTAREEHAQLTVTIESLTKEVQEYREKLADTEQRVASSSEVVSSEVQALEEENIELLKENKELRIEVSRYKAVQGGLPIPPQVESTEAVTETSIPTPGESTNTDETTVGTKRSFGTDLSNTAPATSVEPVTKPITTASTIADDGAAKTKVRRTRVKARAIASDTTAQQVADEAGECKQS